MKKETRYTIKTVDEGCEFWVYKHHDAKCTWVKDFSVATRFETREEAQDTARKITRKNEIKCVPYQIVKERIEMKCTWCNKKYTETETYDKYNEAGTRIENDGLGLCSLKCEQNESYYQMLSEDKYSCHSGLDGMDAY